MFTAKKILKAEFIRARQIVAAMDDKDVLWDHESLPYERHPSLMVQREVDRRARRIYAAMGDEVTVWDDVEAEVKAIFDEVQPATDDALEELLKALAV